MKYFMNMQDYTCIFWRFYELKTSKIDNRTLLIASLWTESEIGTIFLARESYIEYYLQNTTSVSYST